MTRWRYVTAATLTSVLAWVNVPSAAEVSTFGGRAAQLLQARDLTEIARLVPDREVVAIEVNWDQVLPEAWLAVAYLAPDSEVQGVRRGAIVDLKSLVTDKRAQGWRITARDGRYAQVAVPGKPFPRQVGNKDLDRPFRLYGRFSDAELASLIAYVRSSPRKPPIPDDPDGTKHWEGGSVDGHLPVVQVTRGKDRFKVLLSDSPGTGTYAELRYRNGTWRLGEVGFYVA